MKIQHVIMELSECLKKAADQKLENESSKSNRSGKTRNAKLPKLIIETFSGDVLQFQDFWESFQSAVHDDEEIDEVTKFNYLRSFVKSEAAATISGLTLIAENYQEAVNLLKSRYGNKQMLISAYSRELLSLPVVHASDDVSKLREVYGRIEVNIRGLKGMKITIAEYGPMLVQIVLSKLPEDVQLLLSRLMATSTSPEESEDPEGEWKIEKLLSYLKQEIESRELCNFVTKRGDDRKKKYYGDGKRSTGDFTAASLVTGLSEKDHISCTYCGKEHSSAKCNTVTNVKARKAILRRKGRCFLCLKPSHVIKFCESSYKCGRCKGRHHISVCEPFTRRTERTQNETTNVGQSVNQGDQNLAAAQHVRNVGTVQSNQNVDAVQSTQNIAAVHVVGNTKSSTFLQTAKAIASGIDLRRSKAVRVLFDGCSQKSFIAKSVSDSLGLRPVRKENMIIKGFGNTDESMKSLDVVKVRVCDVSASSCRVIEAYIVPVI